MAAAVVSKAWQPGYRTGLLLIQQICYDVDIGIATFTVCKKYHYHRRKANHS
jgi:hypothetical protein